MNGSAEADRKLLAEGVRAFVKAELLPHENLVERLDAVPDDLFRDLQRKAIDAGFYALNMPEEHGGGGLNASDRAVTEIEFGRVSRALGIICNRPAPILRPWRRISPRSWPRTMRTSTRC